MLIARWFEEFTDLHHEIQHAIGRVICMYVASWVAKILNHEKPIVSCYSCLRTFY